MTEIDNTEALDLIDRYVRVWHQLNVRTLPALRARELSREHNRIADAIRRVTGKRPGDLPQVMDRIG